MNSKKIITAKTTARIMYFAMEHGKNKDPIPTITRGTTGFHARNHADNTRKKLALILIAKVVTLISITIMLAETTPIANPIILNLAPIIIANNVIIAPARRMKNPVLT